MTKGRLGGLALLMVCGGVSLLWGVAIARSNPLGMLDFKALYWSTAALLHHQDPYNPARLHSFYLSRVPKAGNYPNWMLYTLTLINYLPTAFLVVAPFALLPWSAAKAAWFTLNAGIFFAAAFCLWRLASARSLALASFLSAIVLVNSELFLGGGNAAAMVVGLCGLAFWCFLEEHFVFMGIVFFALSLAIKPHDVGFIWLFLLLSGGLLRKRALQVLAFDLILGVVAVAWVAHVAPHWLPELRSNIATYGAHGGANDPGIGGVTGGHFRRFGLAVYPGMVIGLQTLIAPFKDAPSFYNPITYLVLGPLFLIWARTVLRSRYSLTNAYYAIAAVVPLTILVTYHRSYDAKLLLLAIPACALLWAEGGKVGKIALALTTAGIVITGDLTLTILGLLVGQPDWSNAGILHKVWLVVITRPVPLVLLAMAVFYLWVYARRAGLEKSEGQAAEAAGARAARAMATTVMSSD